MSTRDRFELFFVALLALVTGFVLHWAIVPLTDIPKHDSPNDVVTEQPAYAPVACPCAVKCGCCPACGGHVVMPTR